MPGFHRSFAARPIKSLALTILLGIVVVFTSLDLRPAPTATASGACPSDNRHLVPWLGGRWFLSGVNVPWQNGGFGADFGTVEAWGQHTYSSAATEQMFLELKARGVNSIRWWVFADGRGAPEFDRSPGGFVTGFDANTLPSLADAIRLAEKHNLYLIFALWSFDMLADGSGHIGQHRDLIVDAARRKSFLDKALIPMLRYQIPGSSYMIGTHPHVISWEVINEPEWGVSESGSVHSTIKEPVTLVEMQRFIAETAGTIHRNSNQLVTVGAAAMKWNSTGAPGAAGNWYSDAALKPFDPQGYLDYYQIHYYEWTNGDGVNWTYSPLKVTWQQGAFDKPVVVGEYPANAAGSGMSLDQMLESIYGNCYAGAWGWSYAGVDGAGSWNDMAAALGAFNTTHADKVRIQPGTPSPQPIERPHKVYLPVLTQS